MAAGADSVEALRRRGLTALEPRRALDALGRVVVPGGDAVAVVADVDWARFTPAYTSSRPSALLTDLPEAHAALDTAAESSGQPEGNGLRQRLGGLPAGERRQALLDLVRGRAAVVLGHGDAGLVGSGQAFRELGVDSLTAVELRNGLAAETGLRLPSTLVFDHPTPRHLAALLDEELFGAEEADAETVLLAELDRLAATISRLSPVNGARTLAKTRLRSMLTELGDQAEGDPKAAVSEQLDEASDDEIFDFINRELGRS